MARQVPINTADDMKWLRDVHLPKLPAKYKSAIIVGNEDYPERIEVYERRDPRVTDVPIVFTADEEGVFRETKTQAHATKKKSPAQLQREIDAVLAKTASSSTPLAKDYRVLVRVEGAPKPVHISPWMTLAQAEHAAKNHKAMIRDRGWTQVVEIEDQSGAVTRHRAHSTIKTFDAPKPSMTVRQINALVRAADGRNVYLIRTRMGAETVQRVTRARTKGRETEVRSLDTGNWLPVLPERGDKLEVR